MLTLRALTQLVSKGESEDLEFKRTTGLRTDAAKTVCAMLNGPLGGFVLFGVGDQGEITGQEVSTQTLEQIANELARIDPPSVSPDIDTVTLDNGRKVIVLRVPGNTGLYTDDGRPYQRIGPTTRVMPRPRYERLLLERTHGLQRWETQPAYRIGIKDLDQQEIVRTVEEAIRRQRLADPGTRDPEDLLLGLNLIHDGEVLNAAVVLFGMGDRLLPHYPQCVLRMARFRGNDKTEFIDNRQEVGHAFDLLIRAQRFLRDHLPVAGRVVPNLFERIDDPLYPPEALREAIANALCHRDYSMGGGSVSIAIYDDRLEIISVGPLPFGLRPDDLARPHPSRPWNPLIAQVFHRRGIIEQWRRGTIKMAELTERAGLAPPEFEGTRHEVVVRFRPIRYVPPTRVSRNLSRLQRELLQVLAQLGSTSLKQIRADVGLDIPERTVQDNLQMLRQYDLIEITGAGRGARWRLKGGSP